MFTRRQIMQAGHATAAAALGSAFIPPSARAAIIDKPAKLILGFPPGGSNDIVGRLLLNQMKDYAPNFVVDNRTGAGGRIAVQAVKTSPPDGAAIGLTPESIFVIFPHVYSNLGYDPLKDFDLVCSACSVTFALAVGPMVPENVKTLQQFVDWCRANPDKSSYGSPGAGSMPHFAGAMIARGANFDFVHVAYRGTAPALQDLAAGQIAANLTVIGNVLPFLESGKVRVLVTTGEKRSSFVPNAPTLIELGLKDLIAEEPFIFFMPLGTPRTVVTQFGAMVQKAMTQPEVSETYRKLGLEPGLYQAGEVRELVRRDLEKWGAIVRATGFKME